MTEPQAGDTSAPGYPLGKGAAGESSFTQGIQRVMRWARGFDRRKPLVWDGLFTAFFVVVAIIDWGPGGWAHVAASAKLPSVVMLCMSLSLSLPLMWRRRTPMAVLSFMSMVALINSLTGEMLQASFLMLFLLFCVALHKPLKVLWCASALVLLPYLASSYRYPDHTWDHNLVPALSCISLITLFGIVVRTRRNFKILLMEGAHRIEVERDQQAQLAATSERARIIREMHDIIGHNLSVITGLADGGAYTAEKNPERASQALHTISSTSREALAELRRLLEVLRHDETGAAELAPQPSHTDLDSLVENIRSAGLPVATNFVGDPAGYPEGLHLTVYRVIQEALANTLIHAGPGVSAMVEVQYAADGVRVTVTDTGRSAASIAEGCGIKGMQIRTALYSGTLEVGPLPARGWRVRLDLPAPLKHSPR
ncbi:sensor histidine kinase [Streptomyces sp. NPDC020330]|uniref:sensor histidine kinase n=1 Tax=unclassified Streptomyces TaxID=2593676 RepID=UPI0037B7D270